MTIRIENTLTGSKEPFEPAGPLVRMYVCGMTPKFDPHLGHAKLFVTMDVIRRYHTARGYDVLYVQNFTDVDDKIIARGQREGLSAEEVAAKYTASYFKSMELLNVRPAEIYPKATETIPEIIEMIAGLIAGGHAYAVPGGDVFYSVNSFADYGKLSHRTADDVLAGARIQIEPDKHDPRDFSLWKAAKPGEPSWDSPWGAGRPGWHIECSAMIRKWLGDQIDIHGGGPDLVFPHHENEIAQSEAFTGRAPFVRYWIHTGQLNVNNEKMAHSLENFTTVLDVLKTYDPATLRLYLLSQHYRTSVNFTSDSLPVAEKGLERLVKARGAMRGLFDRATQLAASTAEQPTDTSLPHAAHGLAARMPRLREAFFEAMDDDFNTAEAIALLHDVTRDVNRLVDVRDLRPEQAGAVADLIARCADHFDAFLDILGIVLPDHVRVGDPGDDGVADSAVDELVMKRTELRKARRFEEADAVRKQLTELGIVIEDSPTGTVWKRVR